MYQANKKGRNNAFLGLPRGSCSRPSETTSLRNDLQTGYRGSSLRAFTISRRWAQRRLVRWVGAEALFCGWTHPNTGQ